MKNNQKKRSVCFMLALVLAAGILMPVRAEAAFNLEYTLGSDPIENLIAVAEAQIDKTKSDLEYNTAWCSYFVSDCARLAGLENVIPGRSSTAGLYQSLLALGAVEVTVPQRGDLVFYYCAQETNPWVHVGIMLSESRSIEGNFSNKVSYVDDQYRDTNGHTVKSGEVVRVYVRPNYSGAEVTTPAPAPAPDPVPEPQPAPAEGVCKCQKSYAGTYIVVTAESPLTMRAGHGTEYDVITRIPKGSEVKVSKADSAWAHVKWKTYSGYCSMEFLAQKLTVSGCYYQVTGKNKVMFLGIQKDKAVNLVIPDTVSYNGKKYQVTKIAASALKGTKIKSVKIGKNVKKIGSSSFRSCKNLKKIVIGSSVTSIGKNTLKGVYNRANIQVPKKKKADYLKLLKNAGMGKNMTVSTY